MFPAFDFLIYCFVTAYTPGANNLLSMSNAARLGFRRTLRFLAGIVFGFLVVMAACTLFSSTLYALLPRVKLWMQILGAAYMLFLAWKVWNRRPVGRKRQRGQLSLRHAPAVYESQNLYLCHHRHVPLHPAFLPHPRGTGRLRPHFNFDRRLRLLCLGPVRRGLLQIFRQTSPRGQSGYGASAGLLRGIPVPLTAAMPAQFPSSVPAYSPQSAYF